MKLFTLLLMFIYDDLDGFVYNDVIPKIILCYAVIPDRVPSA